MQLERSVELISQAKSIVALTGAGISTPSGIPDFRSEGSGIWNQYDPMEVASLTSFRINPDKFFTWFRPLVKLILNAEANAAHIALAEIEELGKSLTVITQNIDGLHQRGGSQKVLEIHGTLTTLTCVSCFTQFDSEAFLDSYIDRGEIPHCNHCAAILKPDAILYQEQLPIRTWMASEQAIRNADLLIVLGSSLEVLPVAGLPVKALDHGARLIVINNTPTYIDSRADAIHREDVAEILPEILNHVARTQPL